MIRRCFKRTITGSRGGTVESVEGVGEGGGGGFAVALGAGGGGGLYLGAAETTHILQHTTSHQFQHVLQQSFRHVLHSTTSPATIHTLPTQVTSAGLEGMMDGKVGAGLRAAPAGSLVVTPTITQHHHPLLQFIHQQATRTTVQSPVINGPGGMVGIKTKAPPQILPKPAGKTTQLCATSTMATGTMAATATTTTAVPVQAIAHAQPSQALLLNQMVANGAVLVQQQTSSGLQLILKSTGPAQHHHHHHHHKPGGLVIANGSPLPQTLILQGRTQAHQVVRLVPGQMQVQQVQTAAGPALIAVPTVPGATSVPTLGAIPTSISPLHKKLKRKKKKEEEPPRLDLANLIKISGIEDDEVGHNGEVITNHQQNSHHQNSQQARVICSKQSHHQHQQQLQQQHHHIQHQQVQQIQQIQQSHSKQPLTHHIITSSPQPQPPQSPQLSGAGLRLSVGEDGTMVVHQTEQGGVSASVAAAAQSQLAQLIADHGGHILQAGNMYGHRNQRSGSVVVAPGQNGAVRVVETSQASPSPTDRLILSPAPMIDHSRLILTGVPTSSGISVEQQNRIIVSGSTANTRLVTSHSSKSPIGGSRVIVQNTEEGRVREGRLVVSPADGRLHLVQGDAQAGPEQRIRVVSSGGAEGRLVVSPADGKLHLVTQAETPPPSTPDQRVREGRIVVSPADGRLHLVQADPPTPPTPGASDNRLMVSPSDGKIHLVQGDSPQQPDQRIRVVTSTAESSRLVMSPSDGRLHLVQNEPPPPDPPPSDTRIQYVGKEFANRPDLTVLPGKPPPPTPQPPRPASFDNPVMESIAQAHPSLVINKSSMQAEAQTQSQPTRVIKMKKPAKKAALVKPMMAEDRDRSPPPSPHSRLPNLQMQPHKQQQLKDIQTQITSLNHNNQSNKVRGDGQVLLQRYVNEQHKILVQGKVVQHTTTNSSPNAQQHTMVSSGTNTVSRCNSRSNGLPSPPTHANKATSPIHIQVCNSSSPSPPLGNGTVLSSQSQQTPQQSHHQQASQQSHHPQTPQQSHHQQVSSSQHPHHQQQVNQHHQQVSTQHHHQSVVTQHHQSVVSQHHQAVGTQHHQPVVVQHHQPVCVPLHQPVATQLHQPATVQHHHQPVATQHHQSVVTQHHQPPPTQHQPPASQHHQPTVVQHHQPVVLQQHHQPLVTQQHQQVIAAQTQQQVTSSQHHQQVANQHHQHVGTQHHQQVTQHHHQPSSQLQQVVSNHHPVTSQQLTSQKHAQTATHHQLSHHQQVATHQQATCLQHQVSSQGVQVSSPHPQVATPHSHVSLSHPHVSTQLSHVSTQLSHVSTQLSHVSTQLSQVSHQNCRQQNQQVVPQHQVSSTNLHPPQQPTITRQPPPSPTLPPPPLPQPVVDQKETFCLAKRAALFEEQWQSDRDAAVKPDVMSPFFNRQDAVRRLLSYHTMDEPSLSSRDLAKADELFEQTAKHLLDKKQTLYNKYSNLLLRESMRMQATSELVLLGKLYVADETSTLEKFKHDAAELEKQPLPVLNCISNKRGDDNCPSTAPKREEMCNGNVGSKKDETGQSGKREREDMGEKEVKKHCPDDEEINAQVQSAIDSILNLQRGDIKPTPS